MNRPRKTAAFFFPCCAVTTLLHRADHACRPADRLAECWPFLRVARHPRNYIPTAVIGYVFLLTGLQRTPSPSIRHSATSPSPITTAPGVPVLMMSPGYRVAT